MLKTSSFEMSVRFDTISTRGSPLLVSIVFIGLDQLIGLQR